jgi:uncharacterized protein (DUF2132 family)
MSNGNDQNKVLNQLYLVTRRVEDLLQMCICRETSWLDVAICLVDVKENVMEIQLDLSWWNCFFKIVNLNIVEVDMNIGESLKFFRKVVNAMKKQESICAKLSKENNSLQQAASRDMDHLHLKLIEAKEKKTNRRGSIDVDMHDIEYMFVVYLLSQIPKERSDISRNIKPQVYKGWVIGSRCIWQSEGGNVVNPQLCIKNH